MLLPSALACDVASHPGFHSSHFVSPPASPPMRSPPQSFENIMIACRSLQNLMATAAAPASSPSLASLPTPPLAHAPMPPKLRLRTNNLSQGPENSLARRRSATHIASPAPPTKRYRGDGTEPLSPVEETCSSLDAVHSPVDREEPATPSTPKRARIAPESLPLGLARSDFHDMHMRNTAEDADGDADNWSARDDRILVELVLERIKLSKTDWQICARSLGKNRHDVGRRWKSLLTKGDIGLKARGPIRNTLLHPTW